MFGGARDAHAFAYIFDTLGPNVVTHSNGYTGTGGNLVISVAIDPSSAYATQMVIPTQNVVNTWNGLLPTLHNLNPSGTDNPSGSQIDYESVLLHEMGHALGLGHVNVASESGLSGSNQNYTASSKGTNGVYDLNPGPDGVIGSADDIRGDDVNYNYFRKADNNPFDTNLGVVDSTTYSNNLADLPAGDTYSANGDRAVANALGIELGTDYSNTEAVMQQGTLYGEVQRSLSADDVAGLLYAESGVDRLAGTADDYTVTLDFLGLTTGADIMIDFSAASSLAYTSVAASYVDGTSDHLALTSSTVHMNSGFSWYFSTQSNAGLAAVDAPAALSLLGLGFAAMTGWRRRKRAA